MQLQHVPVVRVPMQYIDGEGTSRAALKVPPWWPAGAVGAKRQAMGSWGTALRCSVPLASLQGTARSRRHCGCAVPALESANGLRLLILLCSA